MKRLLALLLALTMLATVFVACGDDTSDEGDNPPCTVHTDADGNGKCDACGADVPKTNSGTGLVMMQALSAQLKAAQSMKISLLLTMEDSVSYSDRPDKEYEGESERYDLLISRKGEDVELVLTLTGMEKDDPAAEPCIVNEVPLLYLVDKVLYVHESYDEAGAPVYFTIPLDKEFAAGSAASLVVPMAKNLLGASRALLGELNPSEEDLALVGDKLTELLKITATGGSVSLDLKPYYDRLEAYVLALNFDTKTLGSLLDDALALIDKDLTTAKLLEKLEEYAGLTVTEAMDKIDAWLTKEYDTNLQKIYDEALAKAEVKEMIRAITPILFPEGDWEFEEEYAKLVAFRLAELRSSNFGSSTLWDVIAGFLMGGFFGKPEAEPLPPSPEAAPAEESADEPAGQKPGIASLDEVMEELQELLDLTIDEFFETYGFAQEVYDSIDEFLNSMSVNAATLCADVSFKGAFLLDTLTVSGNVEFVWVDELKGGHQELDEFGNPIGEPSYHEWTQTSKVTLGFVFTLSDVSTSPVTITAPTNLSE